MSILENIHGHQDLLLLTAQQRSQLCKEIREFLVAHVSKTGGHLASNLGVVELTVAIETVYNTAKDRLVFDVGHQSYVHKLLTGRQADFDALRQYGGISGFPKPCESQTDSFVAGHASSSISIALGMARARAFNGQDYKVVTLIGDGAATGGMVYEGFNDAGASEEPMVVILNDNMLSIDKNVGGIASHLRKLRVKEEYLGMKKNVRDSLMRFPGGEYIYKPIKGMKEKLHRMLIPATIFECMGFYYLGPVDGHDIEHLISLLRIAKEMNHPVVIHVLTKKGKGYSPAEEHPKMFHGIGKFDPSTGKPLNNSRGDTFSQAFGDTLMHLAPKVPELCAITAAMPGGTGMLDFKKAYPDRVFDVGIAEEHAMSMTGGLAKQGAIPVIALYSTFLQRSFDMIMQDICMLHQHAVLCVDRAGLVGEDGETHHGIYDVGFLRQMPGLTLLAPASCQELQDMIVWAVMKQKNPVAIRYPRGGDRDYHKSAWNNDTEYKSKVICHRQGEQAVIITYGTLLQNCMDAANILETKGISTRVLRLTQLNPIPIKQILEQMSSCRYVLIVEEVDGNSGLKESIAWEIYKHIPGCTIDGINLGHQYVTHGSINTLYDRYGLSAEKIADHIAEVLQHED